MTDQSPSPGGMDPPQEQAYLWNQAKLKPLLPFLEEQGFKVPEQAEGPEFDALLANLQEQGYTVEAAKLKMARFQPRLLEKTAIGKVASEQSQKAKAKADAKYNKKFTKDDRGREVQRKFNFLPLMIGAGVLAAGGLGYMLLKPPPAPSSTVARTVCEAPNVLTKEGKCIPVVSPPSNVPKNTQASATVSQPDKAQATTPTTPASESGTPTKTVTSTPPSTADQTTQLQNAFNQGREQGRAEQGQTASGAYNKGYIEGRASVPRTTIPGPTQTTPVIRTTPSSPTYSRVTPVPAPVASSPPPRVTLTTPRSSVTPVPAPAQGRPTVVASSQSATPEVTGELVFNQKGGGNGGAAPTLVNQTQASATPPAITNVAAPAQPSAGAGAGASLTMLGQGAGTTNVLGGGTQGGDGRGEPTLVMLGQAQNRPGEQAQAAPAQSQQAQASATTPPASVTSTAAAQTQSPYGPYRPFQQLHATLVSAAVSIEDVDLSSLAVLATTEDGRKWAGTATVSGPNRMVIRFEGFVDEEKGTVIPVVANAYDLSGVPGLQAASQDMSPDFFRNLVRRSATGVRDFAQSELNASTTTTLPNGTTTTTKLPPNIWTTIAGSALGVFDLPSGTKTFYRGAYLPVGTPFVMVVGSVGNRNGLK